MAYARKFNYAGIEPLRDNVLAVLQANIPDELGLIAEETDSDPLPDFDEYLTAEKPDPQERVILIQPDEDDAVEMESGHGLEETNIFDISILIKSAESPDGDTLAQLTTEIIRYKKAVRNVLWSANASELFEGIENTPAYWQVRGGRYTWVRMGNVYARAVRNMKLIFEYGEVHG
jgi:hypothetical protein